MLSKHSLEFVYQQYRKRYRDTLLGFLTRDEIDAYLDNKHKTTDEALDFLFQQFDETIETMTQANVLEGDDESGDNEIHE